MTRLAAITGRRSPRHRRGRAGPYARCACSGEPDERGSHRYRQSFARAGVAGGTRAARFGKTRFVLVPQAAGPGRSR